MLGLIASALALEMRDGVAVGCGFRDRVGAEHAALSAAIVDQTGCLTSSDMRWPTTRAMMSFGPAGRERHDQLDRLARKILRCGQRRQQQQRQSGPARQEISCKPPRSPASAGRFYSLQ